MTPLDFKFELGREVKHKITGYKGIVRGRTQYLTACNTYGVQSIKLNKEGEPRDWRWFDEEMLELVTKKKIKSSGRDRGGPLPSDHIPKRES